MIIRRSVADQYERVLGVFRIAVESFPAGEWRAGDSNYQRPAGLAYHVLETVDFYTSDEPADRFPWGSRFDVDWESEDASLLPSQPEVIDYFEEVEAKLSGWIHRLDMTASEEAHPWTGPSALGKAMYMLRHTQHHLAEMCLELDRRGYAGPEWR